MPACFDFLYEIEPWFDHERRIVLVLRFASSPAAAGRRAVVAGNAAFEPFRSRRPSQMRNRSDWPDRARSIVEVELLVRGAEARIGASDAYIEAAQANVDDAYRLAGYLLGDAAEAQDAVQEALVKAWRNWASLRDAEMFRPWFKRIVINCCNDRLRRRPRIVDLEAAADVHASDAISRLARSSDLTRAVSRLSLDHRTIVALRYWEDMPLEQIAETLAVPLGTVKSRLHYALRSLRAELGDSFNEA